MTKGEQPSRLNRVRVTMLVFGILLVLASLAQITLRSDVLWLSWVAVGLLVLIQLGTAGRGRHVTPWEAPACALLTVLVGLSMKEPIGVVAIVLGVAVSQTLYDGRLNGLLRIVSFLPVFPLTAELSRAGHEEQLHWYSDTIVAMIPVVPLMIGLVGALKGALDSLEQASSRTDFMARMTGRLLAANSPEAIGRTLGEAADELCRRVPGVVSVRLRSGVPGRPWAAPATVVSVRGRKVEGLPAEIPAEVLEPLVRVALDDLVELPGGTRSMGLIGAPDNLLWWVSGGLPAAAAGPAGFDLVLWGVPMCMSERYFGIPGPRGSELVDLVRVVRENGIIAMAAAVERMQLLARASTDVTTGLPNRETLVHALLNSASRAEPCALVMVGTESMRQVTRRHGLYAWRTVLEQLARRVEATAEDVAPDALASRCGDEIFAVLLPGRPDLAGGTAALLADRLAEPVLLGGESITIRIGVGAAGPDDGTGFDLVHAATGRVFADLAQTEPAQTEPAQTEPASRSVPAR